MTETKNDRASTRHLTLEEKLLVKRLVEEAGVAEVLRLLGTLAAHEHPDDEQGIKVRSDLFKIANHWPR